MTIKIDAEKALALLTQAVALRGEEFRYWDKYPENETGVTSCRYVMNGAPACMVGTALYLGGVSLALLVMVETYAPSELNEAMGHDISISDDAAKVFLAAQRSQDDGNSWGAALKRAQEHLQFLTNADET